MQAPRPGTRAAPIRRGSVVSLDERRRATGARRRRAAVLRPAVALWFGITAFACATLLAGLVNAALRHPAAGIPIGVALATAIAWPAAARWLSPARFGRSPISTASVRNAPGPRSKRRNPPR